MKYNIIKKQSDVAPTDATVIDLGGDLKSQQISTEIELDVQDQTQRLSAESENDEAGKDTRMTFNERDDLDEEPDSTIYLISKYEKYEGMTLAALAHACSVPHPLVKWI
ncbi:hypothetical protein ACJJTC_018930 [Scirpophaga incertulas]